MEQSIHFEEKPNNGGVLIQVSGAIESPADLKYLWQCVEKRKSPILVSLRGVEYINSSGAGELVAIQKAAAEKKVDLSFTELSRKVDLVFETMGVKTVLKIQPAAEAAKTAAKGKPKK